LPNKRRKVNSPVIGIDSGGSLCRIPEGAIVDLLSTGDEFVEVLWQARVCRLSRKDLDEKTITLTAE
jgi:hypothetical protein